MIKAVIFDWIGTLYDRNVGPFQDASTTLQALADRKIRLGLVSLTKDVEKRRSGIEHSSLARYFGENIVVVNKKQAQDYLKLMGNFKVTYRETAIVDDRMVRGIALGNNMCCPTFWIKRGEYAHETPNEETGQPTRIISTAGDILSHLNGTY